MQDRTSSTSSIPPEQPRPHVVHSVPLRPSKGPSPLILTAIVTITAVSLGALWAFLTPTKIQTPAAASNMQNQPAAPDPTKEMIYGQTPRDIIPSRSISGAAPIQRREMDAAESSQRVNVDRQLISMNQNEAAIINSHPQPDWAVKSSNGDQRVAEQPADRSPADHTPRVSVVYDAHGQPTLTAQHYDVPAIGEALQAAAKKSYLQLTAAQGNATASDTADSNAMVMPDVESTPGPVTIPAGSRIPAVLDTAVDSDLQGPVRAHISSDVCDPRTEVVAIPRGSWLLGNQGGGIINGQRHLGIVWTRLTYPDLSSRMLIATDTLDNQGHTGIAGRPNASHFAQFRDSFTSNLAASAGQIASSVLSPRIAGNATVVIDGKTAQQAAAPEAHTASWTVARNTPFLLYLERDFDRLSPYHGERCE